ncbi:glycosyltransferase [Dankookia rubra]|uniref:Glycosyltransferase n=1 Tax=Dankookia rubra TaxID=1442381 RepID=A0A4R5QPL3_9PROT|nr:glycosyltransferase family 4 protein [Dankookia rubra]TDH64581.1 glycosyltransferase [Dankookia rubra]
MSADTVGGVWGYALDLAAGMAQRGVTIVLAVLGPPPDPAQRVEAEGIPGLRLVELDCPLEWLAGSAAEVEASGAALAALAREVSADLVHLNSPAPAANASFGQPLVIACHSCLATWWQTMRAGPMPDDFVWRTALVARAYRSADLLVAPSGWFAAATRAAYDLSVAPRVVHNARRRLPLREAASLKAIACTAGRLWDEGKDAATLDAAAALLPFPLIAAGPTEGPNGGNVELRHLRRLGRLPATAMAALLETRPIFVSAALYEPFGLTVLEAAQAGCPLVLSDTAGFRELWDGAATFVAPRNSGGFAAAIERLSRDQGGRTKLGIAAQERATRYSLDRQVDGMLAIYDKVLGRSGRDVAA